MIFYKTFESISRWWEGVWGGVWGKVLVDGFVFCFGGGRLGGPPCSINSFLKIGFEKKPTIPNPTTSAPNDDHVVRNCGFSHSTDLKSTPTTMWGRSSPHLEIVCGVNFKSLGSKATTPDKIHRNWGHLLLDWGSGYFFGLFL